MLKYLAVFLALAGTAQAQQATSSYLVESSLTAARARSAAQCTALGCDGVDTKYWWSVYALTDGTAVVEIEPAGPYGASFTSSKGSGSLTTAEQAVLVPYSTIQPLLPAAQ